MMTMPELIRVLYRAGQAAIAAELMVIAGMGGFLIFFSNIALADAHSDDTFAAIIQAIEIADENPILLIAFNVIANALPVIIMMLVVWSLHLYMASAGVRLMHWVATSVALIGAAIAISGAGMNIWGLMLITDPYLNGEIDVGDAFMGFAITLVLETTGVFFLYIIYPVMLILAAWRDRLVPRWFMVAEFVLLIMSGIALYIGISRGQGLGGAQFVIVLQPFLLGVMLLLKAQELARVYQTDSANYPTTFATPPTEY